MITWMDFLLDDKFGPSLMVEDDKCRIERFGTPSIRKDASGVSIQETGQGQRPARMVGLSSSDFIAQSGMEAGREYRTVLRQRGKE